MAETEASNYPPIEQSIIVNAAPAKVWDTLTNPDVMKRWMAETEIEIITDWKVGNPITVQGPWYKTGFVNKGVVLQFEPERMLSYSHLSSLSRLPDAIENYTVLAFRLDPQEGQTTLTVTLSNFPTESIYKHFAFYWRVMIVLLKKFIEQ